MREVALGFTIRLRIKHYADGALAAPDTSYTIEIEDPATENVVDGTAMTAEGTGIYYYDFTPTAATYEIGTYKVEYKCVTGTFTAGAREYIEVVKEIG